MHKFSRGAPEIMTDVLRAPGGGREKMGAGQGLWLWPIGGQWSHLLRQPGILSSLLLQSVSQLWLHVRFFRIIRDLIPIFGPIPTMTLAGRGPGMGT